MRPSQIRRQRRTGGISLLCALMLLAACGGSAPRSPTATVAQSVASPTIVAAVTPTPFAFQPLSTAPPAASVSAPLLTPMPRAIIPQPTMPRATATVASATATKVSEGVKVTHADRWQAAGITGKGVKVGVIDSSFTDYKRFLAGAQITVRSFRKNGVIEDPQDPEGNHGTACAEIVHEMAPDAELYFGVERSADQFIAAVQWMTSIGVTIISYSNGWDGEYPQDGTSPVAQAVDKAKAGGIFFVVAAGNSGSGEIGSNNYDGHYAATFTDTDGDGFHDFAPATGGAGTNGVAVRIARGDLPYINLEWDDWSLPHVNYSLYLYDASGTEVAHGNLPISRGNPDPVQTIDGKFPAGTYTLKVKKERASDPDLRFSIFFHDTQLGQITPEGSVTVPADARGAVAVGEADWQDDGVFRSSAQGPTRDGRQKPELVAPSCVTNATIGSDAGDDFCGTSAAAPHVAGAAALYRQAFPNATPDDILTYLQQHADRTEMMNFSPNLVGAGRLDLGPPP